jgi:hypothetical protein
MQRLEDSRLRQLWRLTSTLIKVRNGALTHKDVKNEDRPDYMCENKGAMDKMDEKPSGFLAENARITRQFWAKSACCRKERRNFWGAMARKWTVASVARACLEGSQLCVPASARCGRRSRAPSPPALGAPRPLRLVKAPAADPLPRGERAEDFGRHCAVARRKNRWPVRERSRATGSEECVVPAAALSYTAT